MAGYEFSMGSRMGKGRLRKDCSCVAEHTASACVEARLGTGNEEHGA